MAKIAIIGSGISSLTSAWYLKKAGHHITLYEAGHYYGGHTNTIDIDVEGQSVAVDTGFLVHNDRTYPNLIKLLEELDVPRVDSDMSLSVQAIKEKIEWCGTTFSTLFIQKKNIFSPTFWKMILEILKFNKNSERYFVETMADLNITLGDLLGRERYSQAFIDWYLIPMGAAIWSTPASEFGKYPAFTFLQFCSNHGLLQVSNRPVWKTIPGGTRQYVAKIIKELDETFLNCPVEKISRTGEGIFVEGPHGTSLFDYVVSGVHAPINLEMVSDLNAEEKKIIEAFKYQPNLAVVHSDESFLPNNKKGWASWNYVTTEGPVSVSYWINNLQPLPTEKPIIVTLNPHKDVDPEKVYREIKYSHPLFDSEALKAQEEIVKIQGNGGLYFAGAWQGYGFHEDGVNSGLRVVDFIGKRSEADELPVHRESISRSVYA